MAQVTATLSLRFRHRWLGMAFIRVTGLAVYLGWAPGERAINALGGAAYYLMGPHLVVT